MSKIQIVGPKSLLDEGIRILHELAVVHIETVPVMARDVGEAVLSRLPLEEDKLNEKLLLEKAVDRLKNLLFLLRSPVGAVDEVIDPARIHVLLGEIEPVEAEARRLHQTKEELTEELTSVTRYEKILKGFEPLVSRLGGLKNFDMLGLTLDMRRRDVVGLIRREVESITAGVYELHARAIDEATLGVVLTYPVTYSGRIRALVLGEGISEIRLPREYEAMPLVEAVAVMAAKKAELPPRIAGVENEIETLSNRWYALAAGLKKTVEDCLDEIGVLSYCAQTRFCFVIEGWVPAGSTSEVFNRFKELFGGRVFVKELTVSDEDEVMVPVYIHNPAWLRPFEIFLSALPTPVYRSVDPTKYIALFFPAFFGLIVGDVGYGLILFALGLYFYRRLRHDPTYSSVALVLSVCGVTALVFGILFGEFFGDLGERWNLMHPILFDRTRALEVFMLMAIGIGVAHVALGFVIGIVNNLHRGRSRQALGKLSNLAVLASLLTILGISTKYVPEGFTTPTVVVLVLSIVLLVASEGFLGPLEFLRVIGNVLSYIRIMAVGTASVTLAVVANELGGAFGSVFVGVVVAILLHAFNILLSIVSPTIQSLRLQYVEFLTKFYEGGGRRYEPFRKR